MRSLAILSMIAVFVGSPLVANETFQDVARWKIAYSGDQSLSFKIFQTKKTETVNEEILNLFFLSYAYFKSGLNEQAFNVYHEVDRIVESKIIQPSSFSIEEKIADTLNQSTEEKTIEPSNQ